MQRRHSVKALTLAFAFLASFFAAAAQAQNVGSIRGRVTDATTRRPLSSVQISIPGTTRGTLTDANGEYVLQNVTIGPVTLRVQYVGYSDKNAAVTVTAAEPARADFELNQTAISLNEIVVTGTPGATTKRTIGNAISTIQAADITEKTPITTLDQLLIGRTPGLTIMPGAGTIGTAASINIRGSGSLNAGNTPVFYVDGVRFSSNQRGTYGVSGQSRNPLDHLNPDDIETIEVIKGPAASTLYGAEAANGVIQIITKKGSKGQPNVSWSAKAETGSIDWAFDHPSNYKICTAADIRNPTGWPGCVGKDSLAPASTRLLEGNPLRDDPTGIRDGDLRRYGFSARGGAERFSFFASVDRDREIGVFYNNDFRRTAGRVNFQATVLENLDVSFSSGYARAKSTLPLNDNASNGILRNAYRGRPGRADPWQTGYLGLGSQIINQYSNKFDTERFTISTNTNFKPLNWLTSRLTLGLDLNSGLAETFTAIDTTGRAPWGATSAGGEVNRTQSRDYQWTVDGAATAQHTLNPELTSSFSLGGQLNMNRYRTLAGTGRGLISNTLNLLGSAAVTTSTEAKSEVNSVGFYAQEVLGWKDRRYFTAAVRVDDNSAFGSDFTVAIYPKAQVSWLISEEPFFRWGVFDDLRLRGAFGRAGNAPAPFSADKDYQTSTTTFNDGTTHTAIESGAYGNPNLKAETGHEFEIGADAGLFSGRAGVELTYYNNHTKDALINVPAPPSSGFTGNVLSNIGEIANSGFELAVWGSPVYKRNLTWEVRATLATSHNELVSLGGRTPITFGSFADVQKHVPGYPLGGYWYTVTQRGTDGRPILDAQGRATVGDTIFLGASAPTREISLTNTFTLFGNLTLFVFADYKGGHYLWSAQEFVRSTLDQNSFRVNDPNLDPVEREAFISGGNLPYFDNADFIKLREVSLSLQIPTRWITRVGAKSAMLSVAGRNLALWTKYDLGVDPELNFSGASTLSRTDYMSVPMLRRYVASVSFNF